MSSLIDVQQDFINGILNDSEEILRVINSDQLTPKERFKIYRNNTFITLTDILKDTYPVIYRVIGDRVFKKVCYDFICQHPPSTGNMSDYGSNFADFLSLFEPLESFPFLPDVAKLEWAYQLSTYAENIKPLNPQVLLSEIDEDEMLNLTFALHPSCQWLVSLFPIDRIWEAYQEDGTGEFSTEPTLKNTFVLVHRTDFKVNVWSLTEAASILLNELSYKNTLATAYSKAVEIDNHFDLQKILKEFFLRGLFISYSMT